MQTQIRVQALAVKLLEEENRKLSERVAGLEALLYSAGVLGREDFEASPEEKAWIASVMLARYEEAEG